jgi:hypothetical protein
MRKFAVPIFFLVVALGNSAPGQTEPSPSPAPSPDTYEELPELKASEILQPNILSGPHHKVREEVPTFSGANRFTIDSDFGVFEAEGNEMLIRRVHEINAIAKLKDVSRTDQYKEALVKAAKSPLVAAKRIIEDPVGTVQSVPKGVMKFMNRAGESIKNIGKKQESDEYEGSKVEQLIGYSNTKRKVALDLGVDPYSSNPVLQQELEGIAWASFAGGATFSLGTLPIGGAVGVALTTTGVSNSLESILREKSPEDLKKLNAQSLRAMGASQSETARFMENDAFSPTAQTAFVLNLRALNGVANRRALIRLAGQKSSSEADAIFFVETASLMSKLHKSDVPLERIAVVGDFPIAVAKDGAVVVALQWDYAAWTPGAERFTEAIVAENKAASSYLVAISGVVSPRLGQELEARHFKVQDRSVPGPLK